MASSLTSRACLFGFGGVTGVTGVLLELVFVDPIAGVSVMSRLRTFEAVLNLNAYLDQLVICRRVAYRELALKRI